VWRLATIIGDAQALLRQRHRSLRSPFLMIITYIPSDIRPATVSELLPSRHNGKKEAKKRGDRQDGSSLVRLLIDKSHHWYPLRARACTFETPSSFQ
jgi:hypothetical protein